MRMMISSSRMSRRWFWAIFLGIVVLATGLRVWQLGMLPVSLYWDEAAMLVDIKAVLATGHDVHGRVWYQLIYPSYGDYKLPVYIWAALASSRLLGLSEFALRLPSALAGVLTVVVAGLLARALLQLGTRSKYDSASLGLVQLSTMAVVAFTPWSLMFSRTAFEGHLGQMLLASSILLATWGLQKQKDWLLFLAAPVGALATYTYYSVRFVWIAVFIGLVLLFLCQKYLGRKLTFSKSLRTVSPVAFRSVGVLLLFLVLLIPLLRSPLAKDADRFRLGTQSVLNNDQYPLQSNLYRELAGNTVVDRLFYHRLWLQARDLLKNYSDNTSPSFLFLTGDPNLRHGTGEFGLFIWILAPAFLTGWIILFKRHPLLALFLAGWWLVALLPASVPENTPHALRSLNALVPLSVVIGVGLSWWWVQLRHPLLRVGLLSALAFSFLQFWWFYTAAYPKLSAPDWQSGYKPLAQQVFQQVAQREIVFIQPFDDRFYLWLMAYGPYKGDEFVGWKTVDYKFVGSTLPSYFAGVEFHLTDENQLTDQLQAGKKVAVAGQYDVLAKYCETVRSYRCQLEIVPDEVGNPRFGIATLTLSQ